MTTSPARIVAIGDHRIDALTVHHYDPAVGGYVERLALYALCDMYGWVIIRRLIDGRFRRVSRVDGVPERLARRIVAGRLLVLAATAP